MYSRDREAVCPIGLGVFVESIKGCWFVSTRQCRQIKINLEVPIKKAREDYGT